VRTADGLSGNMRIAGALSIRLFACVLDPLSAERQPETATCHPEFRTAFGGKGGQKLRVRGSAHKKCRHPERSASAQAWAPTRAYSDARSRRTPALHSFAEAPFDCGRLVRPGPSSSRPPPSAQDASADWWRAWFFSSSERLSGERADRDCALATWGIRKRGRRPSYIQPAPSRRLRAAPA